MSWIGRRAGFVITGIAAAAIALTTLPANYALTRAKTKHADAMAPSVATGRLYFLDTRGHQVMSANPDGSDLKVLAQAGGSPDGIAVDKATGHVYWTNMATFDPNPEVQGEAGPRSWMARAAELSGPSR